MVISLEEFFDFVGVFGDAGEADDGEFFGIPFGEFEGHEDIAGGDGDLDDGDVGDFFDELGGATTGDDEIVGVGFEFFLGAFDAFGEVANDDVGVKLGVFGDESEEEIGKAFIRGDDEDLNFGLVLHNFFSNFFFWG